MKRATRLNATTLGVKQAFKKLAAKRGPCKPSRSFVARRWPASDERDQNDGGVKSLVRRAIIPRAGVAELADAQDLKFCGARAPCGFDPRPRHHLTRAKESTYGRT